MFCHNPISEIYIVRLAKSIIPYLSSLALNGTPHPSPGQMISRLAEAGDCSCGWNSVMSPAAIGLILNGPAFIGVIKKSFHLLKLSAIQRPWFQVSLPQISSHDPAVASAFHQADYFYR
jgi:hypothetical protein